MHTTRLPQRATGALLLVVVVVVVVVAIVVVDIRGYGCHSIAQSLAHSLVEATPLATRAVLVVLARVVATAQPVI